MTKIPDEMISAAAVGSYLPGAETRDHCSVDTVRPIICLIDDVWCDGYGPGPCLHASHVTWAGAFRWHPGEMGDVFL